MVGNSGGRGPHGRYTPPLETAKRLSLLTAALAAAQAATGLLWPGIYRNNLWASSQFAGNDAVTLALAVPVLAWAALKGKGGPRAMAVWPGALAYMIYNYFFYLFGAFFNEAFLVYVALVVLPAAALVALAAGRNLSAMAPPARIRWRRGVAAYLFIAAGGVGLLWIAQSLSFTATGKPPEVISLSGIHTHLVAAIDLTLMVPGSIAAAVWLLAGRRWGFVLALAYCVKGALYTPALVAMGLSSWAAGVEGALSLVPLWAVLSVASLLCSAALVRQARWA